MCGIAAIVSAVSMASRGRSEVEKMLELMHHRGPDGTYIYSSSKVSLGMTRLAIVGKESGVQPIWNEAHDLAVVCNGEIYNYQSLRKQLERRGHFFQTDSDVEVIVHLYEEYSEDCVLQLEGTFALAIWDERREVLFIARDRIGVKPLFYAHTSIGFAFASELSALLSLVPLHLNPEIMPIYHTLRFAPAPDTIIKGIYKLPAGNRATIHHDVIRIQPYWSLANVIADGVRNRSQASYIEKKSTLNRHIRHAVAVQQAPEVQSATLLSGGVDSTLLVGLQTQLYGQPPDTITVSFDAPSERSDLYATEYDERTYAQRVARQFGCHHREAQFSAQEVWDALPNIIRDMDEPIADPTAIPLWFASRVAHEAGCKVLFSGEGMDELFAGYDLYRQIYWLRALQHIPQRIRQMAFHMGSALELPGVGVLHRSLHPITHWYQSIGSMFTLSELNRLLKSRFVHVIGVGTAAEQATELPMSSLWSSLAMPDQMDALDHMLYFDCLHWLPENTLAKSDKISMAHSVELRVPFLNETLVEYAMQLPSRDKMRFGVHKYLVKKTFVDVIPPYVMKRKKVGFPVPIIAWIFGEWKSDIAHLLLDSSSHTRAIYRSEAITALLNSSGSTQRRASRLLWGLVTMELWMNQFMTDINRVSSSDQQVVPSYVV